MSHETGPQLNHEAVAAVAENASLDKKPDWEHTHSVTRPGSIGAPLINGDSTHGPYLMLRGTVVERTLKVSIQFGESNAILYIPVYFPARIKQDLIHRAIECLLLSAVYGMRYKPTLTDKVLDTIGHLQPSQEVQRQIRQLLEDK